MTWHQRSESRPISRKIKKNSGRRISYIPGALHTREELRTTDRDLSPGDRRAAEKGQTPSGYHITGTGVFGYSMIRLLGIPLHDGTMEAAVNIVLRACREPVVADSRCISASGAHGLTEARTDPLFAGGSQKFLDEFARWRSGGLAGPTRRCSQYGTLLWPRLLPRCDAGDSVHAGETLLLWWERGCRRRTEEGGRAQIWQQELCGDVLTAIPGNVRRRVAGTRRTH